MYTRAGMSVAAIRTFKYASSSNLICNSDAGMSLFDTVRFPLFEDAFAGFEDMLGRGIVPRYLTFHGLNDEFGKQGMIELAWSLTHKFISQKPQNPAVANVENERMEGRELIANE
ncbi:hypothetical protein D5086_031600 [Populus alba]|uniref:Uncharacterized protein n=1 Tax=Populus alba TaxID=43335 RepID=A0ACC4AJ32_POPAL